MPNAWLVDQFGEPESLRWGAIGDAAPGPGQVVIDTRAAGINFFDLLQVRGGYQVKPPFPFVPGAEVAGVRVDTGERVMALCIQGGFGEQTVAEADRTWRIPDALSFEEAAAFLVVYHTSWFVLTERARIQPGETLLVHAGASGTGMSAIQLGLALGARVWATAGSEEKVAFCRNLGAERVVNYRDPSWVEQLKGVDAIYDPVGGDVAELSLKCLNPGGRLLIVGFASGRIPSFAANRLLLRNVSVVGAVWGSYALPRPAYLAETQLALEGLLSEGKIRPVVPHRYSLQDAPQALRDADRRLITGKAVLVR
jgi:NADPH2:quinone reductase